MDTAALTFLPGIESMAPICHPNHVLMRFLSSINGGNTSKKQ